MDYAVLTRAERPAAAYLATRWKQVRRVPERPSGESLDRLRLTLQTREQHIRLNKATSNVCTAPETNMSAMNAVDHRTDELKTIAKQEELAKLGIDTVLFDVSNPLFCRSSQDARSQAYQHRRDALHGRCARHLCCPEGRWSEGHGTTAEAVARTKRYLQQYILRLR